MIGILKNNDEFYSTNMFNNKFDGWVCIFSSARLL